MFQEFANNLTLCQTLCSFQDKLYILSNSEAYEKFITNPRRYLIPPMPRPPCRVSIIGPSLSGKSTLCKLLAQHYNALVIDMDSLVPALLEKVEQERLDKIKEETTAAAIEKIKAKVILDVGENNGKLTIRRMILNNILKYILSTSLNVLPCNKMCLFSVIGWNQWSRR